MKIIEKRYEPTDLLLWDAADDVVEYRLRLYNQTGKSRYDLQGVVSHIQGAAIAAQLEDNALMFDQLVAATKATDDPDVRLDVFQLIHSLGHECLYHGVETWTDVTGGMRLRGGDVYDTTEEHVYCSVCGEEVHASSVDDISSNLDFAPFFPDIHLPAHHIMGGENENLSSTGMVQHGEGGAR